MLPPRYTQAVMMGESMAGFTVSILRIITKASTKSERKGAIAFFVISLLYILLCVACQVFLWRSKFVRYYLKNCQNKSKDSQNRVKDNKNLLFNDLTIFSYSLMVLLMLKNRMDTWRMEIS